MITGLIFWIVVGAIAGFLAEKIMKADMGLGMNIVVGIVGALIGGFLITQVLGFGDGEGLIESIVVATLGAVILLWAINKFVDGCINCIVMPQLFMSFIDAITTFGACGNRHRRQCRHQFFCTPSDVMLTNFFARPQM